MLLTLHTLCDDAGKWNGTVVVGTVFFSRF